MSKDAFRAARKDIRVLAQFVRGLVALDDRLGEASDLDAAVADLAETRDALNAEIEALTSKRAEFEEAVRVAEHEARSAADRAEAAANQRRESLAADENAMNARLAALREDIAAEEAKRDRLKAALADIQARVG